MSSTRVPARLRALPWLTALLLVATLPAAAGEVFKWKDAKGVTHYSDAPPKGTAYQKNGMRIDAPQSTPAQAQPSAGAAPAGSADNPQCITARRNLDSLKGSAPVGLDANGDGEPDAEMNAEQRAAQVQLAEAGIRAWCTPTASAQP